MVEVIDSFGFDVGRIWFADESIVNWMVSLTDTNVDFVVPKIHLCLTRTHSIVQNIQLGLQSAVKASLGPL